MQKNNNDKNIKFLAITTITEIWSQIDWDKVDPKRRMNIWDEFTSKIKASAMTTNNYDKFVDKLCKKMDIRSLKHSGILEISKMEDVVKKEILKNLRNNTHAIVLELRLNNQIKKELKEEAKNEN